MCYTGLNSFGNVGDLATFEDLTDYIEETGGDWGPPVIAETDHVHDHGHSSHSHALGTFDHKHVVATDGGSKTRTARRPTIDTGFDTLVQNAEHVGRLTGGPEEDDSTDRGNLNQPRWSISDDDRVLLVTDQSYDEEVVEANVQAIRNIGATVDWVDLKSGEGYGEVHPWFDEFPGITFPQEPIDERFDQLNGALTANERRERGHAVALQPGYVFLERDITEVEWWNTVGNEYDVLLQGLGGPIPGRGVYGQSISTPERTFRYERNPWRRKDNLGSDEPTFPRDVWEKIDLVTTSQIERSESIRLTDPEGTELEWTNYVARSRYAPCHIHSHPILPTTQVDTRGTIKGTTNHVNGFPAIEVTVEQGKVVEVQGGGEYGELWRETLEIMREYDGKYGDIMEEAFDEWVENTGADLEYDYYDGDPGLFFLFEGAIGTNPKSVRPSCDDYNNDTFSLTDRIRAGVVHLGMGTNIGLPHLERKVAKEGLPWGHVHVHLLFPTLEGTRNDGSVETIIDNGYLTALDHPEVRDLAAQHGDPDEILRVDWVPDIPGISSDGEYEDFATDPIRWMNRH